MPNGLGAFQLVLGREQESRRLAVVMMRRLSFRCCTLKGREGVINLVEISC